MALEESMVLPPPGEDEIDAFLAAQLDPLYTLERRGLGTTPPRLT